MVQKNKAPKFLFSFVLPVYNVEKWIDETVESILKQSLSFEDNCEIIFVNDGSTDNSEAICLKYQQQYPNNVKYVKQKNRGLSATRNRGIQEVEGKYTIFLDTDDKLSLDTLGSVSTFFDQNYNKVDFVALKLMYFDARTGEHPLNFKFNKTRVIDIEKEPTALQMSGASVFIKSEVFADHLFDEDVMQIGEDTLFLTKLVVEKMAYGVVSEPIYYYRKRPAASSIMDNMRGQKARYLQTPKLVLDAMLEYAQQQKGYIPKYVQYVVMYDVQWRFREYPEGLLTSNETSVYKKLLHSILSKIDDDVILDQKNLYIEHKLFVLSQKYGESVYEKAVLKDKRYFYRDLPVYNYGREDGQTVCIEKIESKNNDILITGKMRGLLFPDISLQFKVGEKFYEPEFFVDESKVVKSLEEVIYTGNHFHIKLPAQDKTTIAYYLKGPDFKKRLPQVLEPSSGMTDDNQTSYKVSGKYILIAGANEILVQSNTPYHRAVRAYKKRRA